MKQSTLKIIVSLVAVIALQVCNASAAQIVQLSKLSQINGAGCYCLNSVQCDTSNCDTVWCWVWPIGSPGDQCVQVGSGPYNTISCNTNGTDPTPCNHTGSSYCEDMKNGVCDWLPGSYIILVCNVTNATYTPCGDVEMYTGPVYCNGGHG